jgi:hypothetical protein
MRNTFAGSHTKLCTGGDALTFISIGPLKFSQTHQILVGTHLTLSSLKIAKEKKIQTTKSSNFIGHNIFLHT